MGKRAELARRHKSEGRCTQCGDPASGMSRCGRCRERQLVYEAKKRSGGRWEKGKKGRPPKN